MKSDMKKNEYVLIYIYFIGRLLKTKLVSSCEAIFFLTRLYKLKLHYNVLFFARQARLN